MADFTIDVSTSKTSRINLGIQGENIIEHIIFDISGWIEEFGEGVAYIYAQRKGDENPYPVALDMDMDNGTATWTITDADTAIKGKGKAQLVFVSDDEDSITDVDVYSASSTYSVGDYCLYGTQLYKCKTTIGTAEVWTPAHWDAVNEVKKTRVYATTVQASLVSTSSENPDAYETWLEVLGGYTARIEAAEDDIKAWVTAQISAIDFPVDDVQVDGTSVVIDGVAEIPKATQNQFGVVEITAQGDAPGGYADIVGRYKIQVPYITDANGVVIPIRSKYLPDATTSDKGAMSAADKVKVDKIVFDDDLIDESILPEYVKDVTVYGRRTGSGTDQDISRIRGNGVARLRNADFGFLGLVEATDLGSGPYAGSIFSVSASNITLLDGGIVLVKFPVNVAAGATLRIRVGDPVHTGDIPIYYNNSVITAGVIKTNDVVALSYDAGNNRWHLISRVYANDYTDADKSKLDGIEAGAQVNPVEFEGTDGTSDGTSGLVPAPETTDAGKYLKADGSWGMPANATTSTDGLMPASDKLKTELLGIEEHGAGELSDAGIGIYVYKSEKSRELRGYKENLNANVDRNIWFSDAGRDNSYDNISTNVQMKTPVIYNNDITSKMPVGKFLVKASCTPGNWGWVGIYKGHKEVSDTFGKAEVYCYLDSWPASGGDRRSGGHGSLQNVEFDLLSIYDGYADVHGVYWFFPPGEYTVAVFEADNYTSCIDVCHFAVLDTAWRAWAYDDDFTYNSATKTLKVENIESANVVEDVAILNTYGQRTSIVNDGVAEIPTASENTKGVVSVGIAANREMGHLKVNGYSVPYFIENSDGSMDTYVNPKFLPNAGPNTSGIISPLDKMKLDGIESGAEANVQSDWNQSDNTADDFIKNKPAIVQKPTYKQVFTASSTGSFWGYQIPYNESYTAEDLLNFNAYFINETNKTRAKCKYFKVAKVGDTWRYDILFESSNSLWYPALGDTFVVENMFTDTDGTLFINM